MLLFWFPDLGFWGVWGLGFRIREQGQQKLQQAGADLVVE